MFAHPGNDIAPEFFATLLVNAFVANYRELLRTRRDEDQHCIALGCFVHSELEELPLRAVERVFFEFSTLEKNANLPSRLRFRGLDRADNAIVLELAEESVGSHGPITSLSRRP